MSEVNFNIKLVVDGKERLVSATTDVKHLAEEFEKAKSEASKTRDKLLEATQSMESMRNAISGLQQVVGVLRDFANAASEQEVLEQQLAISMRNTMDAREEDIASVKRLIAAQKELGVVDDEVQLAGAQELATYMEQKKGLEELIPVMNDIIAQQYRLGATTESGVLVAQMMGKVIEGQTGALSRWGYHFDEAQEKILKCGTEMERVAVLKEVVESSVGGSNEGLAGTLAGQAKKTTMQLEDLKKSLGEILLPISSFLHAFDGLAGIIQTAGQFGFGLQGLSVAIKNLSHVSKIVTIAQKAWGVSMVSLTALTRSFSAAMKGATVGATTLKFALRGLLISSGVGLAIAALTFVIEKLMNATNGASSSLDDLDEKAQEAKAAQEEESRAYVNASATLKIHISELEELMKAKKNGMDVSSQEKKIIGELGDAYGETMGYFSSVEGWYKALIANSEAYCQQMVIEARTRRLANEIAELEEENHKILYNDDGSRRKFSTRRDTQLVTTGQIDAGDGKFLPQYEAQEIKGSSEVEKATKAYIKNKAEARSKQKQMNDMVKEGMSIKMSVMGSSVRPGNPGKTGRTGKTELSLIADPKSNNELQNNLRYYESAFNNAKTNEERAEYKKLYQAVNETLKAQNDLSKAKESLLGKELSELKTLGEYEDLLKELRDQRRAASKEDLEQIDERIKKTEEAKQHFEDSFKAKTKKEELEEQLEALQREFDGSVDVQAKLKLSEKISDVQRQLDELSNGQLTIAAAVDPSYIVKGSREDKRQSHQNATQRIGLIKQDYELGIIGKDEALKEIGEIQAALEDLGIEPIEVELNPSFTDSLREGWQSLQGIGQSIESITRSLEGSQDAWQTITGLVNGFIGLYDGIMKIVGIINLLTKANEGVAISEAVKSVAQKASVASSAGSEVAAAKQVAQMEIVTGSNRAAIASFMELATAQYMAAHASIPFAGFGIGAGFSTAAAATVASIGAAMMALPFADGGIVYGPTLGLMGEYSGARSNPEVVAPLDRLRQLIGTPGGVSNGRVRFEIKGRSLVGVLSNEHAVTGKSR